MDGLLAHVLQELAFEGDLGSDVSRLRQIVFQYYNDHPPASHQSQNVDDKFCAFIWSWLATQNNVVVGVAPDGAEAVYFPPQPSKVKVTGKGKNKTQSDDTSAVSLSPLPPVEVSQPLDALITKYGSGLRIAVAPDVCFECITGSHIRPPKLSTNAYAVLQLITRTRREGISAADISRQSGYDPKTCFYFIKILVDLGHILKIKVGGAAVNICVHKSFYDDQCVWKQATKEAAEPKLDTGAEAEAEEEDDDEGSGKEFTTSIQFEPIDNRHMTNPTVVKARIERLLRHMPDGLHIYRHLLEAIGFRTSLKKERRVFTHRVTELIKSRFIEKVWAHSNASSTGRVLCIRLVSSDPIQKDVDVAEDGAGDDPNDNAGGLEGAASGEGVGQGEPDAACGQAWPEGVYATQSVASQIISMVEQSDTTGMTLAEISKNLHNFDVRSVTNLIARFSAGQPPTHLTHRALIITTETFGRERRQRVYTLTAYRKMTEQEGLEDHSVLDPKDSGTWALFEPEDFLADEEEREEWLETFVREALVHGGERVQQRRGKKKRVNPLGKNGAPVKGRPRNEWAPGPKVAKKRGRPPKRKMDEVDDDGEADQPPATKKRRGRPPKSKTTNDSTLADDSVLNAANNSPSTSNTSPAKVTRSRARPRMKNPAQSDPGVSLEQDSVGPAHREGVDERPAVGIQGNSTLETSVTVADIAPQGPTGRQSKKRGRGSANKPTSRLVSHPSSPDSPSNQTYTYKRPRLTKTQSQQLDTGSVDSPGLIQTERQEAVSIVVPSVENSSSAPPLEGLIPIPDREIEPTPALEATDNGPAVATGQIPDSVQVERCTTQPAPRQGKTTNVSALRRQTEFLQLIESMGGVANISLLKSFSDEHQKLLQTLQAAGKAVSAAPGSEMDKRTFTSTISALEGRGLVKKLVVSALTTNGTTRRATIVHLNTASPESVEKCIDEFRSSGSTKGIPLPSDFPKVSESVSHVSKKKTAPKPAPSPSPDPTPPPMDPLSVARHANLSDPKTAAQYAGYIFGHFSRARILHLRLVSEIASGTPPASLASPSARVFSRDYFFGDLPVATYCIIIPQSTVIPGLKEMLEAELGGETRIHDASETIRTSLRPRSATNRGRMQKLLSSLVELGCLVPVKMEINRDTEATSYVDLSDTSAHWDYCRLASSIPVYRYADKALEAPLCHYQEVQTVDDGVKLWNQLREASQLSTCSNFKASSSGARFPGNPKFLKSIRRAGAWEDQYVLSASQIEYLDDLVEPTTGVTPLDDESSTRFDNACFVTTAPVQMVSDFFSGKRANIQRDLVNIQALAKQEAEVAKRQAEEARLALAAKAAQAKKDQETRWDSIVSNALDGLIPPHPRFQKALASLKAEFTVSPQQPSNAGWETKIQKALRDSLGAKPFIIAPPAPAPAASGTNNKPQEVSGSSVSTLILQQGAPIQQKDITPKKSGRKSKKQIEAATTAAEKENTTPESETRRRRFPWNPDYDELARDAGAIVRVRCRSKRMDWSALEQVFPGVQRNSVRQRISSLETLPGASEYYRRLDDAWLALWLEHRGSDALPDPNPDSPSDFDLPAHVVFLRQHIDKEALHAGSETQKTEGSKGAIQLTSVEQIIADYNITEASSASQPTSWDFCFDLASEEPREREFLQHPFVVSDLATIESDVPLDVSVAQAAVKMTISTPEASYDSNDAAAMLALLGEDTVKSAVDSMEEAIVRKKSKAGRSYPLRQYIYSDLTLSRLKGDFASSMYADASAMREHLGGLGTDEWRSIDLTDENGEVAAYLQLMSENKLKIAIDTSVPAAGRNQLGWQSKKVDDENLETHISVHLNATREETHTSEALRAMNEPNDLAQPLNRISDGPCPHTSGNHSTCAECLNAAANIIRAPDQLELLVTLRDAGTLGLPVQYISHEIYNMDDAALLGALATLTQTSPPLAYALGYDQARVVSASVLPEWIVQTVQFRSNSNGSKFNMVFPRQWLDIYGNLLEDIWTMATRSLAGSLMYRPSINEYTLRQRYLVLFDRQELNDILRYLLAIGKLKRITDTDLPVEIHSGDKDEFEANNKAYLATAALLANRASNYGLPSTPEELDEDQQGILNDLSQGVALRFEPPEPLSIGRLIFDLDSSAGLAKTCANFVSLCKGDKGMCKNAPNKPLHYKGSAIHRIARDFVAQGGDVTRDDGSGGESIYGGKFADAKEGLKAKPELGSLAMANSGKNSNTSQFFIVLTGDTAKLAKISGKYVVFGKARLADGGEEILARLGALAGNDEKPIKPVWIEECGVLS